MNETTVIFYPKDIQMWRDEFSFDDYDRPSKGFPSINDFKSYLNDRGIGSDSLPITFGEDNRVLTGIPDPTSYYYSFMWGCDRVDSHGA